MNPNGIDVRCFMEMAPKYSNAITGTNCGIDVDYEIGDVEVRTVKAMMNYVNEIASRLGGVFNQDFEVSKKNLKLLLSQDWNGDAAHYMGGTCLGKSSNDHVVDTNLMLYNIPGVYVLSSSVFPVHGVVNPTLTICALARRLADHLVRASH